MVTAFFSMCSDASGPRTAAMLCLSATMVLVLAAPAEAARNKRLPSNQASTAKSKLAALPAASRTTVALVAGALPKPALAAAPQPVPYVTVVDLGAQAVTIYRGTEPVARAPISSGMAGYATPTGVFSTIQKNRYHESNIYNNAPMPFMQRLTWSGVALHAGKLPGYPASHGCVRLPTDVAERFFGLLKIGTRVIVTNGAAAPVPLSHASLPQPVFVADAMVAEAPAAMAGLLRASTNALPDDGRSTRLLNPFEAAEQEKKRTHAFAREAEVDAQRLLMAASVAASKAEQAGLDLRAVDQDVTTFRRQLQSAQALRLTTLDDEERIQADASIAALEDAIQDAREAAAALSEAQAELTAGAFAEARAARAAEDLAERSAERVRVANRGSEPITVFVSRAERRVQVRQGFHTILEGDVTIQSPDQPLGTHVFTAGQSRNREDALDWTAASIANGAIPALSSEAALSRIAIDPALAREISHRVWHGASLIVSDLPASAETGKGTDFILLTK